MKKLEFVNDPDKTGDESVVVSDKKRRKLDIFPKLICLLIAIVVWLWMVNLNDTEATETKLLKIEYIGVQSAESGNVMFYGMDKTEVTVTIKGSNRDLKKYTDSEYHAVVDVSSFTPSNIVAGEKITLPITIQTPEKSSLSVSDSNELNVSMYVDTYMVKEVPFDAMVDKNNDDTNTYEKIVSIEGNNGKGNVITIAGPSKIVSLISHARYNINSDLLLTQDGVGFEDSKDFDGSVNEFPLTFLNEHYHIVNGTDGMIEYSTEGIDVSVNVTAHKEIAVKVHLNVEGYTAHYNPSTIKIAGKPSALVGITEYPIVLDSPNEVLLPIALLDGWNADDIWIESTEPAIRITFSSDSDNKQ
ncbi:MAG: hypothetical protein E7649_00360 [Ruminococcaceae bacterium]|nr:hypothetical protein [Oscillospiraceae bacterium]